MIQNLIFVILFLKILFPHVPVDIISFFIPEFAAENLKPNKNQPKRSLILQYSFAQKTPHFTNLNSFEIENNILPKHSIPQISKNRLNTSLVKELFSSTCRLASRNFIKD